MIGRVEGGAGGVGEQARGINGGCRCWAWKRKKAFTSTSDAFSHTKLKQSGSMFRKRTRGGMDRFTVARSNDSG